MHASGDLPLWTEELVAAMIPRGRFMFGPNTDCQCIVCVVCAMWVVWVVCVFDENLIPTIFL